MKKIILLVVAGLATTLSIAQNINWRSLESVSHVATVNMGIDNGTTFGAGYGYHLKAKFPILLNTEFLIPAGSNIFDDYKIKIGGQVEPLHLGNFSATARVYGIIRRYQSSLVKMMNYGSELSALVGYYRPKWFVAVEFGFDKAITTHIRHSEEMKNQFPGIKDGWYVPTGGNYLYGLQGGYSFRKTDVTLKAGKSVAQGFETKALFPIYFQLGVNKKF